MLVCDVVTRTKRTRKSKKRNAKVTIIKREIFIVIKNSKRQKNIERITNNILFI